MTRKKVEIVGKFYDNHSLSILNRGLAIALSKLPEFDVYIGSIDRFDWAHNIPKKDLQAIKQLDKKETPKDIDVQIRHSYPPIFRRHDNPNTKIIYIQPWEYHRIPLEWMYRFENFSDHLVVISNWEREAFLNAGFDPAKITSIAVGYDPEVFQPPMVKPADETTFIYVGCHQFRKGHDILLRAWAKAFGKYDPVNLIFKDTPSIYGESPLAETITRLQYVGNAAKIEYCDDELSQAEIAKLYKKAHYVVHPYRGEGFGMPIQEAMACGAIPIVTNGGATDDFVVEPERKIPARMRVVDINEIFAGKPGDSYTDMGSHSWVLEPDELQLAAMLSEAHDMKLHRNMPSVDTSKLTTWDNMAKQYRRVILSV